MRRCQIFGCGSSRCVSGGGDDGNGGVGRGIGGRLKKKVERGGDYGSAYVC